MSHFQQIKLQMPSPLPPASYFDSSRAAVVGHSRELVGAGAAATAVEEATESPGLAAIMVAAAEAMETAMASHGGSALSSDGNVPFSDDEPVEESLEVEELD